MNTNELNEYIAKIDPINIDWSAPATSNHDRYINRKDYVKEYARKYYANKTKLRQLAKLHQLVTKYPDEARRAVGELESPQVKP